jgi:hypothetical protein
MVKKNNRVKSSLLKLIKRADNVEKSINVNILGDAVKLVGVIDN